MLATDLSPTWSIYAHFYRRTIWHSRQAHELSRTCIKINSPEEWVLFIQLLNLVIRNLWKSSSLMFIFIHHVVHIMFQFTWSKCSVHVIEVLSRLCQPREDGLLFFFEDEKCLIYVVSWHSYNDTNGVFDWPHPFFFDIQIFQDRLTCKRRSQRMMGTELVLT